MTGFFVCFILKTNKRDKIARRKEKRMREKWRKGGKEEEAEREREVEREINYREIIFGL